MANRAIVLAAAISLLSIAGARADDDDWVGYYHAIDAIDGSLDTLSIVKNDGDTYRIVMSSTGLGACANGTQPGVITATGRVADGNLVREQVTYRCSASADTMPLPDGTYVRDNDTGILYLEGPMGRANYYHPLGDD